MGTIAIIFLLMSLSIAFDSSAASSSNFSSANSAINSAFAATQNAQQDGGNVSSLVTKLDSAVLLVQKAHSENSTNPSQATLDLQNATSIANLVSSLAIPIAQAGSSATELQYSESIGVAIAIVIIAVLIYIYGGRVYHQIWYRLYKTYVVRSSSSNK
jgi:hypothetical protein